MVTKIQIRNDTTENWIAVNPILSIGEIAYDTTTKRIKVGDGVSTWLELSYTKNDIYDDSLLNEKINQINEDLSKKINSSDVYTKQQIEDMLYITEDELYAKNYMEKNEALDKFVTKTESIQTLENYVPVERTINGKSLIENVELEAIDVHALPETTFIPTKVSELENDKKYLTSVPSEYVTETELENKKYATQLSLTQGLNTKPNKNDLAKVATSGSYTDLKNKPYIPADYNLPVASASRLGGIKIGSGLGINKDGVLYTIVEEQTSDYMALENKPLINGIELNGDISLDQIGAQPIGDYALKNDLPTKVSELENDEGYLTSIPSEYITETELDSKGYLTGEIVNSKADKTYVDEQLDLKANKSDIPVVPTKVSELDNDKGYLTSIPSEYITETELDSKGYLTKHQDISGKADITYVDEQLNLKANKSSTYTKTEIDNELLNKANKSDIPVVPTKVSELDNDKGYLTTHQDISGKADKETTYTKEEVDAKVASVYRFQGSVDSYSSLPNGNLVVGDVYNVNDTGDNYAWTGTEWDKLSADIDLTPYLTKNEAGQTYALKTDLNPYIQASVVDERLATKADKTELEPYAKTEYVNTELNKKITNGTVYTKDETDELLSLKASTSLTYTKTEVNALLDNKQDAGSYATKDEIPDLTDYVKNTDYATTSKVGLLKASQTYSFNVKADNGNAQGMVVSLDAYPSKDSTAFICKGTLDNVLTQYSKTVMLTQAEYDALETKDENTLYLIEEE